MNKTTKTVTKLGFLFLCTLTSCSPSNREIDFLNKKTVNIFTYQNQYSGFEAIDKYHVFGAKFSDNYSDEGEYCCVAFSQEDYDSAVFSREFIDNIYDTLTDKIYYIYFYGFSDLKFLNQTKLDYMKEEASLGRNDVYQVDANDTYCFSNEQNASTFSLTVIGIKDYNGKISFENTVIFSLYMSVYDIESEL